MHDIRGNANTMKKIALITIFFFATVLAVTASFAAQRKQPSNQDHLGRQSFRLQREVLSDPDNFHARLTLIHVYEKLGLPNLALAQVMEAQRLNPTKHQRTILHALARRLIAQKYAVHLHIWGRVGAGGGYDNNINDATLSLRNVFTTAGFVLPRPILEADQMRFPSGFSYFTGLAGVQFPFLGGGFVLQAASDVQVNNLIDRFNLNNVFLTGTYSVQDNHWIFSIPLVIQAQMLEGEMYNDTYTAGLDLMYKLSPVWQVGVFGAFSDLVYPRFIQFSGQLYRAGAMVSHEFTRSSLVVTFLPFGGYHEARHPRNVYFNYDLYGTQLNITWRGGKRFTPYATFLWEHDLYTNINPFQLTEPVRRENYYSLIAGVFTHLTRHVDLRTTFAYDNNKANIMLYQFKGYLLQATLEIHGNRGVD